MRVNEELGIKFWKDSGRQEFESSRCLRFLEQFYFQGPEVGVSKTKTSKVLKRKEGTRVHYDYRTGSPVRLLVTTSVKKPDVKDFFWINTNKKSWWFERNEESPTVSVSMSHGHDICIFQLGSPRDVRSSNVRSTTPTVTHTPVIRLRLPEIKNPPKKKKSRLP